MSLSKTTTNGLTSASKGVQKADTQIRAASELLTRAQRLNDFHVKQSALFTQAHEIAIQLDDLADEYSDVS